MAAVKIVSTPRGEAPEHVREAWIGLVLPLAQPGKRRVAAAGILTGPRTFIGSLIGLVTGRYERREGYVVESAKAIAILDNSRPEAAQWWQKNTPHLLLPGHLFIFDSEACEEVP